MLSRLSSSTKVIGIKQSKKAIKTHQAARVYVANDAEKRVVLPILELCKENNVEIEYVISMLELGQSCGIDVGAAIVTELK